MYSTVQNFPLSIFLLFCYRTIVPVLRLIINVLMLKKLVSLPGKNIIRNVSLSLPDRQVRSWGRYFFPADIQDKMIFLLYIYMIC